MNERAGGRGFSLVEILVGLLILACLIVPVHHIFSGSLK